MPIRSSHNVIQSEIDTWLNRTDVNPESSAILALIAQLVLMLDRERENSYIRGRNSTTPPAESAVSA